MKLRWLNGFLVIGIMAGCGTKNTSSTPAHKKSLSKKVLVGMNVQTIKVLKYPLYGRDGEKWDALAPFATDPDIYVQMSQLNNIIYKSEVREDVAMEGELEFTAHLPCQIRAYTNDVRLELFDEDGVSSDDNMGYIVFKPFEYEKKNTIKLSSEDQTMIIQLGVSWIYEDR